MKDKASLAYPPRPSYEQEPTFFSSPPKMLNISLSGFLMRFFSFVVILLSNSCSSLRFHDEELYQLSQSAENAWKEYCSKPVVEQMLMNATAFQVLGGQVAEAQQEGIASADIRHIARGDWKGLKDEMDGKDGKDGKYKEYLKYLKQTEEKEEKTTEWLEELKPRLSEAKDTIERLKVLIGELDTRHKKNEENIEKLNTLIGVLRKALSDKPKVFEKVAEKEEWEEFNKQVKDSKILEVLEGSKDLLNAWNELSKEEAFATRIILLRFALARAEAERDRLLVEREYYGHRLSRLREKKMEGEQTIELVTFIQDKLKPEELLGNRDWGILEDLRKSEEKRISRLEVLLSYAFFVNRCERLKRLREQEDKFEDLWLQDLRISRVNVSEHQRLVANSLSELTTYHKGGLTERDIGLITGLAEGITALAILKKE